MKKFSKKEAIKFGWEVTKKHFWLILLITVIAFILTSITSTYQNQENEPLVFVLTIIGVFINTVVGIGLVKAALMFANGKKPQIKELLDFKPFVSFLVMGVLQSIIVGTGFVLLIVPGIILLIRFSFAPYFVVGKGSGPIESLKQSWAITKGQTWNLFLLGLLFILINIAGGLLLGIGLLISIPVTAIADAYVYKKLS